MIITPAADRTATTGIISHGSRRFSPFSRSGTSVPSAEAQARIFQTDTVRQVRIITTKKAGFSPFPNGERPDFLFFGRRQYSDSVAQDYIIFEGTIVDFPTCLAPTAMTALKAELICGNFRSISRLISWLSISHRMQISENFRIIIIVIIKGRGTKRRLVYTFVLNCCLNSSTKIQPHGYCFFSPDMI